MAGVGTMALPADNSQVSTVGAPPTPDAYRQAVQQSLQPTFDASADQLAARQAAMGTLSSGQGNKDFQTLYANNNATVAGATAPLIQQGFAQTYGANQQNASAANSYQQLLQQQAYGAGQNQINNNLQAQEFNAGQGNQFGLAQMGYSNSNYQQQMAQLAGLQSQGLGGQISGYNQGANNQLNAYTNGYQNLMPYLSQTGQGQGYGTVGAQPGAPATGIDPTTGLANGYGAGSEYDNGWGVSTNYLPTTGSNGGTSAGDVAGQTGYGADVAWG